MSDKPKLYDVELSIKPHQCGPQCKKAGAHDGPAKVNSEAFQSEWQRIFGGKGEVAKA